MKTEITLTLSVDPNDALAVSYSVPYFQERANVFDRGVQLCASGVPRYVKLPKGTRQITVCFFKRHVAESFEIGRRVVSQNSYSPHSLLFAEIQAYCMIDHPRTELLQSFRRELYRYYIKGYKFFRIEY